MPNADRIIEVLHEAKARPAGPERDGFVELACGDDPGLKEQIVSLIQAEARDCESDFLHGIPVVREPAIYLTERPGDRIGRYKLLEQIGEGGCGVVYMADQEQPVRRRVAVKVIKLGMDTKQVIARFEAERQALAMMDHPNIAKVLDGGATETGRPYFVMELVRGIKITDYCDQKNLSTKERLELFIQVCQAVQHAHQKGIIHRDLKPSNILVTQHDDLAVPKIIDFGIAKATSGQLTDRTLFTAFSQFVGTPSYMSPEQAQMSGLDVDTRADIYSLGVLLYELLTGNTPFDAKELAAAGLDEMRRKIREDEPARPSTCLSTMAALTLTTVAKHRDVASPKLIHLLSGDLDWLVMKCLEKDRTRRYETASGLAMDLQRHLDNEPVLARPPSAGYRFQKLIRRNKLAFAAGTAVVVVLLGGIAASTWQAIRATRAEREQTNLRAQAEANERKASLEAAKSQQVAEFMKDMMRGVGPSVALGRDTTMLREILDKTAERIGTDLKEQPDVEAELRNTIGAVYWQLGEFSKATAMHQEALAIQRKLHGNEHVAVATSLHHLADALRHEIKLEEAETAFRESLAIRRKLLGNEHADVAQSLNHLASLLSIRLKDREPETLLREALAIRQKLYGREHREVAMTLDNLAHVLRRRGDIDDAAAMHYESLEIRKKAFGDTHPELLYSFMNLADVLESQGKLADAEGMIRQALALSHKLLGQQHPQLPRLRGDLARILRAQEKQVEAELPPRDVDASSKNLASAAQEASKFLRLQGNLAAAEVLSREGLAIRQKALGKEHPELANPLSQLADLLLARGKLEELDSLLQNDFVAVTEAPDPAPQQFGHLLWRLGDGYLQRDQLKEAERIYGQSLLTFKRLQIENPANPFFRQEQAFSLRKIAIVMQRAQRLPEAEASLRRAWAIYRELAKEMPATPLYVQEGGHARNGLLEVLIAQGKAGEAEILQRDDSGTAEDLPPKKE